MYGNDARLEMALSISLGRILLAGLIKALMYDRFSTTIWILVKPNTSQN